MGASITHGQDIVLINTKTMSGKDFQELSHVDGDFFGAAYSTVDRVIEACLSFDVLIEDWPIYYGLADDEVPLEEVRIRCAILRSKLRIVTPEYKKQDWFLKLVCEWLEAGEIFCVLD